VLPDQCLSEVVARKVVLIARCLRLLKTIAELLETEELHATRALALGGRKIELRRRERGGGVIFLAAAALAKGLGRSRSRSRYRRNGAHLRQTKEKVRRIGRRSLKRDGGKRNEAWAMGKANENHTNM
jgi:hypothetical protein